MKITESTRFDGLEGSDLTSALSKVLTQIAFAVNGNLDPASNLKVESHEVTFPGSATNVIVRHGLGRTPVGYIPVKFSAAMSLYDGSNVNSSTVLNLRSNAAGTATVLVF